MWSTTSQTLAPVFTPFGGGFVVEHHRDGAFSHLAAPEPQATIDFSALLATLRTALWLRS
jgi:hypothetical protein